MRLFGTTGGGPARTRFGGRLRRSLIVITAAAMVAVGFTAAPAFALANVSTAFELDGDVLDNGTSAPDWGAPGTDSIFVVDNAADPAEPRDPLPAGFLSAGFARDFVPGGTSDGSTFTTGSKDILDISAWKCVGANNVTDKGDIQNAYAAAYWDDAEEELILYFGMEKNAPNGNNNMAVWFLRDGSVGCTNPSTGGSGLSFTGTHQDGDILLVAAFTGGGDTPEINAYKWQGGALDTTALATGGECGDAGNEDLCAITNDTSDVSTPWLTQNKADSAPQDKTGLGNNLDPDQFYEGAINLTENNLDTDSQGNPICINKFLFNTRSSQELTATLYDFAAGDVQTCAEPAITTNLYKDNTAPIPDTSLAPPDHTVTLPADVYDTATITGALGTPTGTVTYSLWTDNTCETAATSPTFPGGVNTAEVTIAADGTIPPSPTLTFENPGSFWWKAEYSGGGRNGPAESDCTEEPLVVEKVSPNIATTPSATTITIGNNNSFSDTATISGGYFPSGGIAPGNVNFKLYGPFDAVGDIACTAEYEVFDNTKAAARVNDSTATATSDSYTPTSVGIYQWRASYSGNAQNNGATSDCTDPAEQVVVQPATPPIATKILLSDKVKVSAITGAGDPTGSVLFQLYDSADCSGSVVYSESKGLLADGTATTTPTLVDAGTYAWKVTFTSSNPNYSDTASVCSAAQSDETATISYAGTSPIS